MLIKCAGLPGSPTNGTSRFEAGCAGGSLAPSLVIWLYSSNQVFHMDRSLLAENDINIYSGEIQKFSFLWVEFRGVQIKDMVVRDDLSNF